MAARALRRTPPALRDRTGVLSPGTRAVTDAPARPPRPPPQVWDDGTLAAPLAALRDEGGLEGSPLPASKRAERAEAEDPDFSLQAEEGHSGEEGRGGSERAHARGHGHGHGGGGGGHHGRGGSGHSEEDEAGGHHAYSSDSPRVSV